MLEGLSLTRGPASSTMGKWHFGCRVVKGCKACTLHNPCADSQVHAGYLVLQWLPDKQHVHKKKHAKNAGLLGKVMHLPQVSPLRQPAVCRM